MRRHFSDSLRCFFPSFGLVFTCAAALPAQIPAWHALGVGPTPGIGAMAYDDLRDRVVFFGGGQGYQPFAAVLEFDGVAWAAGPYSSPWPTPRFWPALAYDSRRGETVMNGGNALGPIWFTDTWRWNGATWTQASPVHVPPSMLGHSMTYDEQRDRIVMFGSATWEWDGTDWLQRTPSLSPPARNYHGATYDARRSRTVIFGGMQSGGLGNLADTWEWDGSAWLQVATTGPQPTAIQPAMAFDRERARSVLVGQQVGGAVLAWEFDGIAWAAVSAPASTPISHMAYDRQRGRIVLFAAQQLMPNSGMTSAYDAPGMALAQPYGVACGSPALRVREDAAARPVVGSTFGVDVLDVPAGIAFMCFGWSNRQVASLSLPMSMAVFGMPGCWVLQSDDAITLPCAPSPAATARFSLAIPNDPSFSGLSFFVQPWAPAPGMFSPVDAVVGNAVAARIGTF